MKLTIDGIHRVNPYGSLKTYFMHFPIHFESKKQAIESVYQATNPKQVLIGVFRNKNH